MPKGEQEKSTRKILGPLLRHTHTHTSHPLLDLRKHMNLSHTCTQSRTVGNTGSILWPKCVTEELNVNNTHTDAHTGKALWHWPQLNKLHLSAAPVEMWGGEKEEREKNERVWWPPLSQPVLLDLVSLADKIVCFQNKLFDFSNLTT